MREILFRGKCKRGYDYSDGDGWVYGSLLQKGMSVAIVKIEDIDICPKTDDGYSSIDDFGCIPVEENTIGQYTGLTDKNGTKIFEGDILEDEGTLFTVFYADGGFAIESNPKYFGYGYQDNLNPREPLSDMQMGSYVEDNCEVVGNIHDNKALLGNDR